MHVNAFLSILNACISVHSKAFLDPGEIGHTDLYSTLPPALTPLSGCPNTPSLSGTLEMVTIVSEPYPYGTP